MASQFSAEGFQNFCNKLDADFKDKAWLQPAVKATGQRPAYVLLGGAAAIVFLVLVVFGIETVSALLLILPIYASFKALKSPDKKDDTQYLTYWVLVGVSFVIEEVIEEIFLPDEDERTATMGMLGFLYYVAKIVFFQWAADHNTRGAQIVYDRALLPAFNKVEAFLEKSTNPKSVNSKST